MKLKRAAAVVVGVLTLGAGMALAQGRPGSSAKAFKYKGGKVETGMLYTYIRSDLAGTKEGSVLVYVPDKKRVEIFRVNPGSAGGQLLTAEMNWDTCSLRQFELWSEGKDGGRSRQATGVFSDSELTMTVEDPGLYRGAPGATTFSVPLPHVPAHIYSLDAITIGLALRHLAEKSGPVEIGVLTENRNVTKESPNFLVPAGKVTISFVEDVERDGIPCSKYQVTGAALGAEEGFIWLHREKGYIQDAEIPASPGPDWPDVKVTLQSAEKVAAGDWPLRRTLEISRVAK